jgi:hypothetical protein
MEDRNEWLREQIAFAIFNSTNPPHVRDSIAPQNTMDWSINRGSFLKLADVAIRAFEAADADGSAYREAAP